jgi:peptide/nickel transport system permease protein
MDLHTSDRLLPPTTRGHILGTDHLGRDVLSRVIWGARRSLLAGFGATLFSLTVGATIGMICGYWSNFMSELGMQLVYLLMAFPPIVLAILIVAIMGPGLFNAMVAIMVVGVPVFARLTQASVLSVRQETYVEAARAVGAPPFRILWRHILPNVLAPLLVTATLDVGNKILATAGLSFLGLGTQPPAPDWGNMIAEGRRFLSVGAHISGVPGFCTFLIVLALNFLGDGLRDAIDPTMREQQ